MPGVIDLRNTDVHIASDALIAYCENLTKAVQSAKERADSCWQTPPECGHAIIPIDFECVVIKIDSSKKNSASVCGFLLLCVSDFGKQECL